MTPASFIDANIPIYATGKQHPNMQAAQRILRLISVRHQDFVTNSEVLQEILHYYLRSGRWEQGQIVMRAFSELMNRRIEPVYPDDFLRAAQAADDYPDVSARDLVHASVMHRLGITRIISADRDFDRIVGVERLDPAHLDDWEHSV